MVPKILGYDCFSDRERFYLEFDIEFPNIFRNNPDRFLTYNRELNPEIDDRLVGIIRPTDNIRVKVFIETIFSRNRKYLGWRRVYYFSSGADKNNIPINHFCDRKKLRLRDPKKFLEDVLNNIKPQQLVTYFDTVLIWWYRTRMKNY